MQVTAAATGRCQGAVVRDPEGVTAIQQPPSPEVLRALQDPSTPATMVEVRRFASRRAKLLRNAGHAVPDGYARELVDDACTDTWVGTAKWDPARCSLKDHLTRV